MFLPEFVEFDPDEFVDPVLAPPLPVPLARQSLHIKLGLGVMTQQVSTCRYDPGISGGFGCPLEESG